MTMSGSPTRVSPLPNLVIAHEDYTMFERLIRARVDSAVRRPGREHDGAGAGAAVEHGGGDPGQRAPGRGGHPGRASGQLGPGARASPTTAPGRWSCSRPPGPSRARALQAEAHDPVHPVQRRRGGPARLAGLRRPRTRRRRTAFRRCWCWTTAPAPIMGQALQGRDELADLWQRPAGAGGLARCRQRAHGDEERHRPSRFIPYGVPGLQLRPGPAGLLPHPPLAERHLRQGRRRTTCEQAAAVMAVTAFELANLPSLLPRGPRSEPERCRRGRRSRRRRIRGAKGRNGRRAMGGRERSGAGAH